MVSSPSSSAQDWGGVWLWCPGHESPFLFPHGWLPMQRALLQVCQLWVISQADLVGPALQSSSSTLCFLLSPEPRDFRPSSAWRGAAVARENGANSCLPLWCAGIRNQHNRLILINLLHPLSLPGAACALAVQQRGVWLWAAAQCPQGWPHIPALPLALLAPYTQHDCVSKSVS